MKKLSAFTLAEVLIILAIIGVVAALTIPSLMRKYQNYVLQTQFKEAHSLISNALKSIVSEHPNYVADIRTPVPGTDWNNNGRDILGADMMKKLKTTRNCSYYADKGCDWNVRFSRYRNFTNTSQGNSGWAYLGYFNIENNMTLYTICSQGCRYIHIFVDVNGLDKKPNRQGFDLFDFQLDDEGNLVPATQHGTTCNRRSTSDMAGFDCTKQAIIDPDYFKNLPK